MSPRSGPDHSPSTDDAPTTDPSWTELLEDAASIADEYREDGWDAALLEPIDVSPSEREDRFGFDVLVSDAEYGLLETLVENEDVTFADAEVYYRPAAGTDRRLALAVERDATSETAVCVPLTYAVDEARPVLETAVLEGELLVHVRSAGSEDSDDTEDSDVDTSAKDDGDDSDQWVTFSHGDPSLFLEESDLETGPTE
ncbi:hypothetical protein [Natrialba sp. INN-245]|uniref:DUF7529 family protein n=1 Tax=Natrialba sp. INN-245 TaxID=2690967 RepID=UPI00130FEB6A|nr:hypothetical protein [Natrialba sp. INN-245]MWV41561.1 hypothetical protein [Natrialba sp. INN-245]